MGLDMYLYKQKSIYDSDRNKIIRDFRKLVIKHKVVDYSEPTLTYNVEVAYWRKAYAIDRWIFRNQGIDDLWGYRCSGKILCDMRLVYGKELLELYNICKKILKNKSLAPTLLPAIEYEDEEDEEDGYNDYYFFQLEQTIAQFNKIKIKEEDNYVYSVSY